MESPSGIKPLTSYLHRRRPVDPRPDGSYRVAVGQKLKVSASADHYGQASRDLVAAEGMAGTQDVQLRLKEVVVRFEGLKPDGSVDAGAKVTVTHVEEDPYGEDEDETVTDRPGADGRYALALSDGPYAVTITGSDGYKARTSYEPDGSKAEDLVRLKLYDDPNQARVDAVAKALDESLGALRPSYRKDKNANELVRSLLAEKLGPSALEGVTVSVASTADPQRVAADGSIGYRRSSLDGSFHNPNVSCSFAFAADDCTAVSKPKSVTIGWDQDYFHSQMEVEGQAQFLSGFSGLRPRAALEPAGRPAQGVLQRSLVELRRGDGRHGGQGDPRCRGQEGHAHGDARPQRLKPQRQRREGGGLRQRDQGL